jgi:hypothetical protein
MFPFGSIGALQVTVKAVEFAEVTVSERTSEGATNAQNISCCYLTQCFGQVHNYNSTSYLTLQCSCELQY